jgi:hypothetical protein
MSDGSFMTCCGLAASREFETFFFAWGPEHETDDSACNRIFTVVLIACLFSVSHVYGEQGHLICMLAGGKALGLVVHTLKQRWVESDFNLTSEDLLQLLPDVLSDLGVKPNR